MEIVELPLIYRLYVYFIHLTKQSSPRSTFEAHPLSMKKALNGYFEVCPG